MAQFPFWYLFISLGIGLLFAVVLYFKQTNPPFSRGLRIFLGSLRAIAVGLIVLVLLGPFIKNKERFFENPIVLILSDNSSSLLLTNDSLKESNPLQLKKLFNELSNKVDVRLINFSDGILDSVTFDFNGGITNIGKTFKDLDQRFGNKNIGAIILSSDGIWNAGSDPLYEAEKIKAPIFTIALGDTTTRPDLAIKRLAANSIVFKGNEFPVLLQVQANKLINENVTATLFRNAKNAQPQKVAALNQSIISNEQLLTFNFNIPALDAGNFTYKVVLNRFPQEVSFTNNEKEFVIDVIDSKSKVLIYAASPHPDVSAWRNLLESSKQVEVDIAFAGIDNPSVKAYDLVIFHQLPTIKYNITNIAEQCKSAKIGMLFLIGKQTQLSLLNQAQNLALFNQRAANQFNKAVPISNVNFNAFRLPDGFDAIGKELPPLDVPFTDIKLNLTAQTLFYQKIGLVTTQIPLLFVGNQQGQRVGILVGEGFWRWRLSEHVNTGSATKIGEFVSKLNQYLSLRTDKRNFKVYPAQSRFMEGELVSFMAELYDETLESVKNAAISLVVTNEKGKRFQFSFLEESDNYQAYLGRLPAGKYQFEAKVQYNNQNLDQKGEFQIIKIDLEGQETKANHQLLQQIAMSSGGEMLYPNQIENLALKILKREDLKPTLYEQTQLQPIINIWIILPIILLILALEWLLRKYFGSY